MDKDFEIVLEERLKRYRDAKKRVQEFLKKDYTQEEKNLIFDRIRQVFDKWLSDTVNDEWNTDPYINPEFFYGEDVFQITNDLRQRI